MAILSYFVLYTPDMKRLKAFYEALGMAFVEEQHGAGPTHYATLLEYGIVLEIYPGDAPKKQALGFTVESLRETQTALMRAGMQPEPVQIIIGTGRRSMVLKDPDGRRVEIIQLR